MWTPCAGLVLVDQTPSAVPPDLLLSLLEILEWMLLRQGHSCRPLGKAIRTGSVTSGFPPFYGSVFSTGALVLSVLSVSVPMILLKSLLIFYILFNRQGQADLLESSLVYISNSRPTGLSIKIVSQKVKTKYILPWKAAHLAKRSCCSLPEAPSLVSRTCIQGLQLPVVPAPGHSVPVVLRALPMITQAHS